MLCAGSQLIHKLDAAEGCCRRIINRGDEDRGFAIAREDVGLRHQELKRYALVEESLDEIGPGSKVGGRGSQHHYDWEAARLEACRPIYFGGVAKSDGALIRHL